MEVPSFPSRMYQTIVWSSTTTPFPSTMPTVVFDGACTKVPSNLWDGPSYRALTWLEYRCHSPGATAQASAAGGCVFQEGDRVFGCSLFGAYSDRVAVPVVQLRKIPDTMSFAQAAALPAVSLTALYALYLAGHYPPLSQPMKRRNTAILIHSAAGGVGSMAIQMSKQLGLHPIVGIVVVRTKLKPRWH